MVTSTAKFLKMGSGEKAQILLEAMDLANLSEHLWV